MINGFIRFEIYSIEEVFNWIEKYVDWTWNADTKWVKIHIILHHLKVKLTSQRYRTFMLSGTVCKECGLEGKFFALEGTPKDTTILNSAHLNLYGIDKLGQEVLMTKDHIIPRCEGGSNSINNYQTLCTKCNGEKGLLEKWRIENKRSIKKVLISK